MALLALLTILLLPCPGCGKGLVPLPLPCPSCDDSSQTTCRYISLDDGTRIRAQYDRGDPNLPLIVGVHGFGGTYLDVHIVFPQGLFPTLSFSLPGSLCSDSLPPGTPHTIEKGAETLKRVLEQYQDLINQFGDNNVLIAGASFGAMVVEDYFVRNPTSSFSAVIIAGQDTPETTGTIDLIEGYLNVESFLFPAVDNSFLHQYLASARVFDVSREIVQTQNRWLVIGCADDDLTPGGVAMAQRLGDRAQYAEIPGNHFMLLVNGGLVLQVVENHLDFLRHGP
jgi:pimeloyl-ACP methyl ester carboxylesterase